MNSKFSISLVLVLAAFFVMPCQELFAQQLGFILGKVVDEEGNPIKDAKIRIEGMRSSRKYTLKTNEKGEYIHAGVYLQGVFRVICEKEGYVGEYVQNVRPGFQRDDERGHIDFTMKKGKARKMAFEMTKEELEEARKRQEEAKKKQEELEKVRGSFNQAVEYYNSGQYEQAVLGFQEVLKVDPDQSTVWANLAATYSKLEQRDRALEAYSKAIELEPGNAAYYQNRGSVYASLGDDAKAREDYEKAASLAKDLNPRDAAINYYNMGVTYINAGKNQEAADALMKALEVDPNHAESHYQLGITMIGLNEMEKAIQHLRKYLELAPNGQNAEVAKALIEQLGG